MKLKLFLILCISLSANAQNLSEILNQLSSSKAALSIREKSYLDIAVNKLSISQDAPEFGVSLSHAKESSDNGLEYGIGVSQNISHPFSSLTKNRASTLITHSITQEVKYELHLLSLQTASLYHSTCISKEIKDKAILLYDEQSKRFMQFQKAYDFGEISRNTLLFNKLDLVKLKQKISVYKRAYLVELSNLQEGIDNVTIENLACDDLLEIRSYIGLNLLDNHSKIKRIDLLKDSSKSFYELYDAMFQTIAYELSFEKELDAQKVTFGLSVPLSSLTSQNEKLQAQYLHKTSALNARKGSLIHEISSASKSLQLKLQTLFDEYILVKDEILPLNKELLKLSKSALAEGEGTIMEYLDSYRSYSQNMLEILQIKKKYYNELFKLYKKADLQLGENYANIY